jgi:hypothetical protein
VCDLKYSERSFPCFYSCFYILIHIVNYKNKGSKSDPEMYQGITLNSCFSKTCSAILDNWLNDYAEHAEFTKSQDRFRKGFSTSNEIHNYQYYFNFKTTPFHVKSESERPCCVRCFNFASDCCDSVFFSHIIDTLDIFQITCYCILYILYICISIYLVKL